MGVAFTFPQEKPNAEQVGTAADFLREHNQEFSSLAVLDDSGAAVNLSVNGGHAVQVNALRVSEGYFRTLGVAPALGRGFSPEEDRPGGGRSVVLSDGLWKHAFGRDPNIVGRAVHINEDAFTVVAVMPAGFEVTAETAPGVMGAPDLWQPLQLSPATPGYEGDNFEMIGRLRDGTDHFTGSIAIERAQFRLLSFRIRNTGLLDQPRQRTPPVSCVLRNCRM